MIYTPNKARIPQYLFLLVLSFTILISAAPVTVPERNIQGQVYFVAI
jgi:hypothetical protein